MHLPDNLEDELIKAVIAVEEELEVEYISSVERYGIKKGVAQGIEQGRREAEEKLHNSIRQLIVQGILNDAQIAEVFDVPVADIAQLRLETKH